MKNLFAVITVCLTGIFTMGFTSSHENYTNSDKENVSKPDTLIDHHAHIFSPQVRKYIEDNVEGANNLPPLGIEQLIQTMERDNIGKAVVLSNAYFFSDSAEVSAENDRVAKAISEYSDRTIGFFGINPLSDFATDEIDRNAAREEFAGIKLHFANAGVDFQNQEHVKRLAEVFEMANSYDLGIVAHMRTTGESYGREDALIFVDEILSQAPDVPVQIAHMAGWSGYDEATDKALGVFADRIAEGKLDEQIYFDLSAVVKSVSQKEQSANEESKSQWDPQQRYERLTERLKTIGMDRLLFGTDWPEWMPADYKSDLRDKLLLTESELQTIFSNRAPWAR